MAIKYKSSRYTTDVDFSTVQSPHEFDEDQFFKEFDDALLKAEQKLPYPLKCFVQKIVRKPTHLPEPTFPTYEIKVGYVSKLKKTAYNKAIREKRANNTVKIDYSLNEVIVETDTLTVSEDLTVPTYSLTDLISEKLRSILQQIERNRSREQDCYDLYYLLTKIKGITQKDKITILNSLIKKSKGRLESITSTSLSNPEIRAASEKHYNNLKLKVSGDLPLFDEVFTTVLSFYKSLPWDSL